MNQQISVVSGFANIMANPAEIKAGAGKALATKKEYEGAYRLKNMPRGQGMILYAATVFKLLGAFTKDRKSVKHDDALAFFTSSNLLDQWIDVGITEETKHGIRLTTSGFNYLSGLLFGEQRTKERSEKEMARLLIGMTVGKVEKENRSKLFAGVGFVPAVIKE